MLKKYDAVVNGHETTLLLSDEDAKAAGLVAKDVTKKAAPKQNKSRKPSNKSAS